MLNMKLEPAGGFALRLEMAIKASFKLLLAYRYESTFSSSVFPRMSNYYFN